MRAGVAVSLALSVNIELLFRESGDDPSERIRAAAHHGITVVEIWSHSDKDLGVIEKALAATGSTLHTLLIEGRHTLADAACRLGCRRIVTGSGVGLPYLKRAVQHGIVVDALKAGADIAAERGVTILPERWTGQRDCALCGISVTPGRSVWNTSRPWNPAPPLRSVRTRPPARRMPRWWETSGCGASSASLGSVTRAGSSAKRSKRESRNEDANARKAAASDSSAAWGKSGTKQQNINI
jgi:hypothetical protein